MIEHPPFLPQKRVVPLHDLPAGRNFRILIADEKLHIEFPLLFQGGALLLPRGEVRFRLGDDLLDPGALIRLFSLFHSFPPILLIVP